VDPEFEQDATGRGSQVTQVEISRRPDYSGLETAIKLVLKWGLVNGMDAQFCRRALTVGWQDWTLPTIRRLWEAIDRAQLRDGWREYGIQLDGVPRPPRTDPPVKTGWQAGTGTREVSCKKPGEFSVSFDYDPRLVNAIKQIPYSARTFSRKTRQWLVRVRKEEWVDIEAVNALWQFSQVHGLEWTEEAQAELEKLRQDILRQHERQKEAEKLSRDVSADIQIEGLGGELRPFQRAGLSYALQHKRVFIADEMGLGKTVQALATIHAGQAYPALVVCPKRLKTNWQREAQKWLPGVISSQDPEDMRHGLVKVLIINYDVLKKWHPLLEEIEWKAVIADESHYCKNRKTLRTRILKDIMKVARPKFRLLLTGTPVENRPAEYLPQLEILDRVREFGDGYSFLNRYCWNERDGTFSGARNLEELNQKLRGCCYVRRKKSEVLKELPAKQRAKVIVELDNFGEYAQAERDIKSWLKENLSSAIGADAPDLFSREQERIREKEKIDRGKNEALVKLAKLKQIAAKGKLSAAKEWIGDFLESGEKLIVFAYHIPIQQELARMFPAITVYTRGEKGTQYAVDAFQRDPNQRIIVCSFAADREGITLTASSNVLFVEQGWTSTSHDQAEDRAHRIGQEDSVTAWYMLADKTIDMHINAVIEGKRAIVDVATDGGKAVTERSTVAEIINRMLQ